jgi:hypothetical protein
VESFGSLLNGKSKDTWCLSFLLVFAIVLWLWLGIKRTWRLWEKLVCFAYFILFIRKTFLEMHMYFVHFKILKDNLDNQKKNFGKNQPAAAF